MYLTAIQFYVNVTTGHRGIWLEVFFLSWVLFVPLWVVSSEVVFLEASVLVSRPCLVVVDVDVVVSVDPFVFLLLFVYLLCL